MGGKYCYYLEAAQQTHKHVQLVQIQQKKTSDTQRLHQTTKTIHNEAKGQVSRTVKACALTQ